MNNDPGIELNHLNLIHSPVAGAYQVDDHMAVHQGVFFDQLDLTRPLWTRCDPLDEVGCGMISAVHGHLEIVVMSVDTHLGHCVWPSAQFAFRTRSSSIGLADLEQDLHEMARGGGLGMGGDDRGLDQILNLYDRHGQVIWGLIPAGQACPEHLFHPVWAPSQRAGEPRSGLAGLFADFLIYGDTPDPDGLMSELDASFPWVNDFGLNAINIVMASALSIASERSVMLAPSALQQMLTYPRLCRALIQVAGADHISAGYDAFVAALVCLWRLAPADHSQIAARFLAEHWQDSWWPVILKQEDHLRSTLKRLRSDSAVDDIDATWGTDVALGLARGVTRDLRAIKKSPQGIALADMSPVGRA